MKRLLLSALILVVLVIAILFCFTDRPVLPTELERVSRRTLKEELYPKPAVSPTAFTPPTPWVQFPQVTMSTVEYKIDPIALIREREGPPFEFRGGVGTGRVIDRERKVLMESGEDIGIFGVLVGPNKEKVLVKGGDAKNLVIEPSTGRKITLPPRPPVANMLGFGNWHWIGPKQLFGTSGVERIFQEGPHENCVNDNNVAQTKFYTFDLDTGRLSEVAMPSAVTQPVVHVVEVTSDGHIHLMNEKHAEGTEQDLGWFKIEMPK